MPPFAVRTLPVSRLKPARYNPRKPLSPQSPAYRKLRASIERFGLVEPLVWNARSGRLVGGHARLRILKDLGVCEIPVSVVRLSPAKEKALNIVLNNREAQGRYDPKKLTALLHELKDLPEFEDSGFSEDTLRTLDCRENGLPDPPPDANRVEVTLVASKTVYSALEPKLDALVREYDLLSHVLFGSEYPKDQARNPGGTDGSRRRKRKV
ncbi:MAG TPA: ParB N-terminal domain-containing protein [Fimbriiglobus sp.]|jgi:hypothetical protein